MSFQMAECDDNEIEGFHFFLKISIKKKLNNEINKTLFRFRR